MNVFQFDINNKSYHVNLERNHVESICLFGSFISKDFDEISDIDLLIIIENCNQQQKQRLNKTIAKELGVPSHWLTLYTKNEFLYKCRLGDYFVWSLRLQAQIIYTKTDFLQYAFSIMPYTVPLKYTLKNDWKLLNTSLKMYRMGRRNSGETINTLAFCLRDACILLCYLNGVIDFGKYDPIRSCMEFTGVNMPFSFEEYETLYRLKRLYKFDHSSLSNMTITKDYIFLWYRRYTRLINEIYRFYDLQIHQGFESPLKYLA